MVAGGFGSDSMEPTVVFSYRVPLAAYQGWKSALRVGKVVFGVSKPSKPRWGACCLAELRWRRILRKKRESSGRDLFVFLWFLRVLSVKRVCNVPLFSI